jgi:hypothetical protein
MMGVMRKIAGVGLVGALAGCPGGGEDSTGTATAATTSGATTGETGGTPTTGGPDGTGTTGTTDATSTTTSGPTTGTTGTTEATTNMTTGNETDTGEQPACGAIVTFADGKAPAQEIHVAMNGADGPNCGAQGSPCASIEFAAGLAQPGTAVRIHSGTYAADSYIDGLAGTAEAPIWLGGAPGETPPVIAGGTEAIHFTRARYLVVHDLEVDGASGNGINIDDGAEYDNEDATRWVVFRNLKIHDIGMGGNQDCLKMSGVNDYWVLDSEFSVCGGGGGGSAIDHVGCHRGTIAGNYFHDNGGNAVQSKGGSDDIEIRGNRMVESGQRAVNMGGSTGFEFFRPPLQQGAPNFEARNIRLIANTIVGGETPLAFVGCVDCVALNNTIVRPHNWLMRILQETVTNQEYEFLPASNGVFANNVVVFDRGDISTYVNIGGNTAPDTFSFTTNLWYAADDPGQSDPSGDLPVAEVGGLVGVDPQLVDLAGGDFHLNGGSPAAGSGTGFPALSADFDGVCYGDPPSRGAFELP